MGQASIAFVAMAAALATPLPAQVHAQDDDEHDVIEAIVVTAQKRAESVQDVPIAISAYTADMLQERAVGDVSGLSAITPNVTFDASTNGMHGPPLNSDS